MGHWLGALMLEGAATQMHFVKQDAGAGRRRQQQSAQVQGVRQIIEHAPTPSFGESNQIPGER